MGEEYSLEWLDTLISVSLNPAKVNFHAIRLGNSIELKSRVEEEKNKIQSFLKRMVFSLDDEKKIELLIKNYHSSLVLLLDQALENNLKCPSNLPQLKQLTRDLILCTGDLLAFIETRFLNYLSLDERIPATDLYIIKKDLKQKLGKLKSRIKENEQHYDILDVVLQELYSLISASNNEHLFTLREIAYIKELCKKLGFLDVANPNSSYTSIDQALICMNFNNKAYIDNLTKRLSEKINACENISDKMEMLLFHFKEFKQMHHKPRVVFDPHYRNLQTEVHRWFKQEIFYLEKKLRHSEELLSQVPPKAIEKTIDKPKILCMLSVDQMGIILRSIDDLKIIMARSLNAVFKSIVPYLSTSSQENISYDSMRSKSYSAETRDKEIVVKTLSEMIKKIKEY